MNSPTNPVNREALARIIDPDTWNALDVHGQLGHTVNAEDYCKRSLIKADQWLSRPDAERAEDPVLMPSRGVIAAVINAWDDTLNPGGLAYEDIEERLRRDPRITEDSAGALIERAARLFSPEDGEAVFYIRVGGSFTQMKVETKGAVDPDAALRNAIAALEGERGELSNCPVHKPPPIPPSTGGEEITLPRVLTQEQWDQIIPRSPLISDEEHDENQSYGMVAYQAIVAHFTKNALSRPQPVAETVEAVITDEMVARAALELARITERRAMPSGRGAMQFETNGAYREALERRAAVSCSEHKGSARSVLSAALRPSAHGEAGSNG